VAHVSQQELADAVGSVREVVARRVSRLGPEAGRILSIACVIGRDFSLDVLARVAEVHPDATLIMGGGDHGFVSQMIAAPSGALYGVGHFVGGAFELAARSTAPNQDIAALSRLESNLADPDPSRVEISVASDGPAVAMRRYLHKRAHAI